jgi:hypothetical protein
MGITVQYSVTIILAWDKDTHHTKYTKNHIFKQRNKGSNERVQGTMP